MTSRGRSAVRVQIACLLAACALSGCVFKQSEEGGPYSGELDPEAAGGPTCDPTAVIDPGGRALLVTEPEALAELPLEDVLSKLLEASGDTSTTPLELFQRMFDTNNREGASVYPDGMHCDSAENPAHANGPAAFCPRGEGALAASDGVFTPGHPDHFRPVAVVNRMDLEGSNPFTCGEARILYAKESGLTDPEDRVFLMFEVSVPQPNEPSECLSLARWWKDLEDVPRAEEVARELRSFFFDAPPDMTPLLHPANLGLGSTGGGGYYGQTGQLRVSQHMDEHWEMRQLVASMQDESRLRFVPTTVGNNPMPGLFDPKLNDSSDAEFALDFAERNVGRLAVSELEGMTMDVPPEHLSGESALGGEAINDYAARGAANSFLLDVIALRIEELGLGAGCPEDDPLTPDSILRRATMDSCAGCHAPARFLGPEREIGCGLTWPASLGEVHIDESGRLSPALTEVFLPQRAALLTEVIRTCP